ncbi:MAG TPA: hypothetical protein VFM97_10590 [Gammaproteobacteria bacterium]|nr:hypothetical protein [Gammaproteobacteria bacterium]
MARHNRPEAMLTGLLSVVVWAMRGGDLTRRRAPMEPRDWRRVGWVALVIGTLGIIACAVGAALDLRLALQAWLFGLIVWIALPLGAMAMLMCHNLTGGGWGEPCRPALKAMIATLPLIMLGFVPLLVVPNSVFSWVAPAAALPAVVQRKAYWLNVPFLWARTTVFFAAWLALAWRLNVWRREPPEARPFGASGGGMVAWCVTLTFFAFDWLLSLQPRFYSDIFGMVYFSDVIVVGPAAALVVLALANPSRDEQLQSRMHDIGNLLLAALCGWIFVNFVQYLIIWNGNIPDEITWYIPRSRHGWQWCSRTLFIFYFALPFAALLSKRVKRSRKALLLLSAWVLFAHALFAYWLVMPSLHQHAFFIGWRVFAALFGLGGLMAGLFAFGFARRAVEVEEAAEGVVVNG